ncbi:hypothetical protein MCOR25_002970 [Pyricularia grisea]|nr:hypothetical protein MCOR25_002970 [Pyricularia grisea]
MNGFALKIKRNYECSTFSYLKELVLLGQVRSDDLYEPNADDEEKDTTPRGRLEKEATKIPPPSKGQNIRAPIDGVGVPLVHRCAPF